MTQRALILDGRRSKQAGDERVVELLEAEMADAGYELRFLVLRKMEIAHCIGCFHCWVKTPGQCIVEDGAREVAQALIKSDLVVFLTPVTFGGYSYELKKALDRIICLISPFFTRIDGEVHHKTRYAKFPRLLAVGLQPEVDPESQKVFSTLVARNAINMHSAGHATLCIEEGRSPELIRSELHDQLVLLGGANA